MSKQVQAQKFTLSGGGVSAAATSISLVTLKTPDGVAITMTDFGNDVGYATMQPGTSREESISFTGITGTTLTGVSRGLRFVSPFDIVAGNKKAHAGGSILVFSNTSAFYSRFVDDFNAQTIGGLKTFTVIPVLPAADPTTGNQAARKAYVDLFVPLAGGTMTGALILNTNSPSTDLQAASKKYVDDTASSGAPNASTTVKGIVQEATDAQVRAGTATGSTGARLYVNPASIFTSVLKFGGTGSDGALTISSGTTTIDLANASLVTKNYTSISITGTGKLAFTNPNTNGTIIILKAQGNVTLTSSTVPCIDASGLGGAGGTGGTAGNDGSSGTAGRTSFMFNTIPPGLLSVGGTHGNGGTAPITTGITNIKTVLLGPGSGGGGGSGKSNGGGAGGGASLINNGVNGSDDGGNSGTGSGGDGGNGGGALYIECGGTYTASGTLTAAGINGSAGVGGGVGGGGGGAGGTIIIYYNILGSNTGTYTISGGTGGAGASLGAGGAGGTGYSSITLNTDFA